jgi:signal peptidase
MGSRLLGYRVFNVISGSMEPKYSVGDLIYVKAVDVNDIKVGDDITFILNEDLMVATHRVVRIDAEKQHFYTKGLANDIEDSEPVHYNNVIGVPHFSLPLLGYVSDFIQNPPGTYVAIGAGVVLLLLVFLPDMISKKKKAAAVPPAEPTPEALAAAEENERLKAELEQLRAKVSDQESE